METKLVNIGQLRTDRNIRDTKDAKLSELAQSIKENGLICPVLVKEEPNGWVLVAGHRRVAAMIELGHETVAAIVLHPDVDAETAQIVENIQRSDLSPLEECAAIEKLQKGQSFQAIAAKLGRPPMWVYNRLRLKELTPGARELLKEGRISAGHAEILSRLSPADQKRAMSDPNGLWAHQRLLFGRGEGEPSERDLMKPRTVKELQAWVDQNVRFDPRAADVPFLFPDTAAKVANDRCVLISEDYQIRPGARGKGRVFCVTSWKPATRRCEFTVTGVIAAGPGRGKALDVCTEKKRCRTHWGKEIAEKERAGKTRRKAVAAPSYDYKAEEAKRDAERARMRKALPDLSAALLEASRHLEIKAVLKRIRGCDAEQRRLFAVDTAEGYVRAELYRCAKPHEFSRIDTVVATFKSLGIDARAIINKAAPAEKPKPARPSKKPRPKKASAKRGKAKR